MSYDFVTVSRLVQNSRSRSACRVDRSVLVMTFQRPAQGRKAMLPKAAATEERGYASRLTSSSIAKSVFCHAAMNSDAKSAPRTELLVH